MPGLIVILALSALFLSAHPPRWVEGAAGGAGAAVPAVALSAAIGLAPASWRRAAREREPGGQADQGQAARVRGAHVRWICYLIAGGTAAALTGPFLVLVLVGCGLVELLVTGYPWRASGSGSGAGPGPDRPAGSALGPSGGRSPALLPLLAAAAVPAGGLLSIAWVAFKVGALSYGGGFVIIPLMQHDAVDTYHWMSSAQFLSAVALGQITPGPVVQTVSVVGYAAAGIGGALLASLVAFTPSFIFVLAVRPPLRSAPAEHAGPGFPHRRRARRGRRHRRCHDPAGSRLVAPLAAGRPRPGPGLAHRAAARGGEHASRRRGARSNRGARRGGRGLNAVR